MKHKFKPYHSWVLLLAMLGFAPLTIADELLIAVRANKGSAEAMQRWQATTDHLHAAIPAHRFVVVPFENNSALNQAVSSGSYAFSLTNHAAAVEHKIRYGYQSLATLVNLRQGKGYSQLGSVIFTRSERRDISVLQDLKGKIFVGVDELGFGGWRIPWYELLKHGVDPYQDFKELRFAGGNQEAVALAVLRGEADAGAVRTDLLEGMAAAGKLNLAEVKVLNAKQVAGFPFLLSSELYPEWQFSASKKTSAELRRAVASALWAIQKEEAAARSGKYAGWIAPADTTQVEALMRELKVGPFSITSAGLLKEFFQKYLNLILLAALALVFLFSAFLYVTRLNRQIAQAQANLMREMASRERAEQALTSLAQHGLEFAKDQLFFNQCLTELAHLFAAKFAFIGLFADEKKDRIKTYAVWGGDRFLENFEYALAGTPCQDVLNQEVEIIDQDAAHRYPDDKLLAQMGIESYFGAPLITASGEMLGLVSIMDTKPLRPTEEYRPILRIFANRITLELLRKREEDALQGKAEQLSYQASHDALTNLVNRREFDVRMKAALGTAKNQQRQHALCFLDLDQFKQVNDNHGHHAGDDLLKQVSARLSSIVRGSDTLARLGGDEFGVLLLDCPLSRAREIAEKLLEAVRNFRFEWDGDEIQIGASIGVTSINAASGDMHEVFQIADAAAYMAKALGRNRVHVHAEPQAGV